MILEVSLYFNHEINLLVYEFPGFAGYSLSSFLYGVFLSFSKPLTLGGQMGSRFEHLPVCRFRKIHAIC